MITWESIAVLLALAGMGMAAYIAMLWLPLKILGVPFKDALAEITIAEGLFYGLYSLACATVVAALFSRFI